MRGALPKCCLSTDDDDDDDDDDDHDDDDDDDDGRHRQGEGDPVHRGDRDRAGAGTLEREG